MSSIVTAVVVGTLIWTTGLLARLVKPTVEESVESRIEELSGKIQENMSLDRILGAQPLVQVFPEVSLVPPHFKFNYEDNRAETDDFELIEPSYELTWPMVIKLRIHNKSEYPALNVRCALEIDRRDRSPIHTIVSLEKSRIVDALQQGEILESDEYDSFIVYFKYPPTQTIKLSVTTTYSNVLGATFTVNREYSFWIDEDQIYDFFQRYTQAATKYFEKHIDDLRFVYEGMYGGHSSSAEIQAKEQEHMMSIALNEDNRHKIEFQLRGGVMKVTSTIPTE